MTATWAARWKTASASATARRERQRVADVRDLDLEPLPVAPAQAREVPLRAGARERVEHAHAAALGEQALDEVRADEARAAGHERARLARHASRGPGGAHDLLDCADAALAPEAGEQLRPAVGAMEPEVVVPDVDVEAVAGRFPLVEVLGRVPVDARHGRLEGVEEHLQLSELVVAPGREADLGHPDLRLRGVVVENPADALDRPLPALPDGVPAAGERVQADRVDDLEDAVLAHDPEPVRVGRAHAAEHGLPAALAHPVGGLADHAGEELPAGVERPVPVVQVVRLVPELDVLEVLAVPGQQDVEEVRVVARPARRRLDPRRDRQRRRRVDGARQHARPGPRAAAAASRTTPRRPARASRPRRRRCAAGGCRAPPAPRARARRARARRGGTTPGRRARVRVDARCRPCRRCRSPFPGGAGKTSRADEEDAGRRRLAGAADGYAPSSCRSGSVSSGVEAEAPRDLLAGRLRALAEERAEQVAGLAAAPPVLADLGDEVRAQLGRADPGAQVVGRVEAGVHVREVRVRAVADAGRLGQRLLVAVGRAAVLGEAAPEGELEAQLRLVAAEEQRLEEGRRLGVLRGLRVGEAEVARVPLGLPRDRLADVRVDLGQRVVAGDPAEGVGEARVAAGVVERVPGLVQEGLVVVEAALGAGDQVDDARRVGGDHAGARRLLRPVVEVEADVRLVREVEAEVGQRREADLGRALLRVGRLERREPAHPGDVVRRRNVLALGAEQLLEPALAQPGEGLGGGVARLLQRARELAQRDPLLLLVARDGIRLAGEDGGELLAGGDQLEPLVVEGGGRLGLEDAELLAVGVGRQHRELRLRRPERERLAVEVDPGGEDPVLERVLARRELGGDDAGLAGLAQAVEALALVAVAAASSASRSASSCSRVKRLA